MSLLVAMQGLAGTGKSTLARELSRAYGWPLIDKDDVRDLLSDEIVGVGALAYQIMWRIAQRQLSLGMSVIADSPLSYPQSYATAQRIADRAHAQLVVISCRCSDVDLWQQRINHRATLAMPAHHQTDWARFQAFRAKLPPAYAIDAPYLQIDTIRPLDAIVEQVSVWLKGQ